MLKHWHFKTPKRYSCSVLTVFKHDVDSGVRERKFLSALRIWWLVRAQMTHSSLIVDHLCKPQWLLIAIHMQISPKHMALNWLKLSLRWPSQFCHNKPDILHRYTVLHFLRNAGKCHFHFCIPYSLLAWFLKYYDQTFSILHANSSVYLKSINHIN